jgi:uncharacterized HAD superfamily protein
LAAGRDLSYRFARRPPPGGSAVQAGRIYVDLDDVLAQTIRPLTELLERHFGRRVDVEAVVDFDLGRSFRLSPAELAEFMRLVHRPEVLDALPPSPGAAQALQSWLARGYAVDVMTGRPASAAADSRRWLHAHGIPHTDFACVDKYARPQPAGPEGPPLALDDLPGRGYALAVEDSLEMAAHLAERCGVPVALMDRPWNRDLSRLSHGAATSIVRCRGWGEVTERFPNP